MTDRERLINALIGIAMTLDTDNLSDDAQAVMEAVRVLKAQEPRVMTLEELKALEEENCVWLEDNGEEDCFNGYGYVAIDKIGANSKWRYALIYRFGDEYYSEPKFSNYGKTWRCWTARPTDEQREAVEWDSWH